MKKIWLLAGLVPTLALAQSSPNFTPGSVLTAQALNQAFQTKVDISTLGQANGPAQLDSTGLLPNTSIHALPRIVIGTTDTITTADNDGVVDYNNGTSAVAVTLPCTTGTLVTNIVELGTGTVTVTAASTACKLNGTANGYVTLTPGTSEYQLVMAYNGSGSAAQWFIK